MILEELLPRIFHITFPTQKEMTSTLLRFQEYYESPVFRGRVFSLDEYKRWYIANTSTGKKTGKFTYYSDFSGFNLPSEILEPFYAGKFDPLSEKEKRILDLFNNKRGENFYVIGTSKPWWSFFIAGEKISQENVLRHELAHGLFYTNPEYRDDVRYVLASIPEKTKAEIQRFFQEDKGYHKDVWEDEMHAWVMCDSDLDMLGTKGKVDISGLRDISQDLNLAFESHSQK